MRMRPDTHEMTDRHFKWHRIGVMVLGVAAFLTVAWFTIGPDPLPVACLPVQVAP